MRRRPRERPGLGRRVVRTVLGGLLGLVLLAVACVAGVLWWSLPAAQQRLQIAGLTAPATVSIDADGVPRIHAASSLDGATALGFVHARDRMFQMELTRRNASGRLSEIAGPLTLRQDRTMRILGLRHRAEADLAALQPETQAMLAAYARGVNAWIAARGRFAAPEFIPLGPPEPWAPVDSLLWGKTMALYLSGNYRTELARAAAPGRTLWPPQPDTPRPEAALPTRLGSLIPAFPEPFTQPGRASNEWAVDGRFTASGAPLLAGDPHLGFSMPSLWYLARIETPEGVLAGATAPGVPFLILGHNGHVAWTFTTTGADTQDIFVETPQAGGYMTEDGPRPFVTREERIGVRGQPKETITIRETRHGPVLSDLDPGSPILAVAMASLIGLDTGADGLLALNRAHDVAAVGEAATLITSPVQNLLVADAAGIAQFTTGRIPLRRAGDGSAPVAGADGRHDWIGFASGADLPRVLAPESGRIVNANERVAPPDFPVFLGQDWFGDWRARRIRHEIEDRVGFQPGHFAALQVDDVSEYALTLLPALRAVAPADAPSATALGLLATWDGAMRTDLPQPLIFNAWMRAFEAAVLSAAGIAPELAGARADVVAHILSPEGQALCGGDCAPLLSRSLAAALAEVSARQGPDPSTWRWGREHRAVFAHPLLGRLPLIGHWFTWAVEQPGDDTTLFRGGARGGDWTSVHGAGFRGVYDLADLDRSLFALTPGQSGHPLRAGAGSLMQRWVRGTTLLLGPEAAVVSETVELTP